MTSKAAAIRYARALFDVALKEQADLEQIETQLATFVDLFSQHPTLAKVLLNPAVPVPRKRAAVTELTARLQITPVLAKLLTLLAERDRLVVLPISWPATATVCSITARSSGPKSPRPRRCRPTVRGRSSRGWRTSPGRP